MVMFDESTFPNPKPCAPPIPGLDAIHAWTPPIGLLLLSVGVVAVLVIVRSRTYRVQRGGIVVAGASVLGVFAAVAVWALTKTC